MAINRARSLADFIAVQIHSAYSSAPGNVGLISAALEFLSPAGPGTGIRTLRDDTTGNVQALVGLVKSHSALLDIYVGYPSPGVIPVGQFIAPMKTLVATGAVRLLEGPLEVDNQGWGVVGHCSYGGKTGWPAAIQMQADLFAAFKGQVPVAAFSSAEPGNGAAGGPMQPALGSFNYGNVHFYAHNGQAPCIELAGTVAQETGFCTSLPYAITEAGFNDGPVPGGNTRGEPGINAKYTLNLILAAFSDPRCRRLTYYELFDDPQYGTDFEAHFGLFNADGSPKPAATALRNLMSVLSDPAAFAATFTPVPFPVVVTGLPADGKYLQFQRADGTNLILVWIDTTIYLGGHVLTAEGHTVQIALPGLLAAIVHDPIDGTSRTVLASRAAVDVQVSDHLVIVEVPPASVIVPPITPPAPPAPAKPSPEGTTITTGAGSIVDAAGHVWTIGPMEAGGPRVYIDGKLDIAGSSTTWNVARAFNAAGLIWHQNTAGGWWHKAAPADTWAPAAGMTTDAVLSALLGALRAR